MARSVCFGKMHPNFDVTKWQRAATSVYTQRSETTDNFTFTMDSTIDKVCMPHYPSTGHQGPCYGLHFLSLCTLVQVVSSIFPFAIPLCLDFLFLS